MSAPEFPVSSFREAAPHLRRPFTAAAVRHKVQAMVGQQKDRALVVAYIDARLVVERLNLVCPHLWSDEYERREDGTMMCSLTVDGLTRRDVGDGYKGKGIYSDALKRAAVKFGIGVSLYATPALYLTGGELRRDGTTVYITPEGERKCRNGYRAWLTQAGVEVFGDPLDHGDTEDSAGDVELIPRDPGPDDATPTTAELIDGERAQALVDRAIAIDDVWAKYGLALAALTGEDPGDVSTTIRATAATMKLTVAQADKLEARIAGKEGAPSE